MARKDMNALLEDYWQQIFALEQEVQKGLTESGMSSSSMNPWEGVLLHGDHDVFSQVDDVSYRDASSQPLSPLMNQIADMIAYMIGDKMHTLAWSAWTNYGLTYPLINLDCLKELGRHIVINYGKADAEGGTFYVSTQSRYDWHPHLYDLVTQQLAGGPVASERLERLENFDFFEGQEHEWPADVVFCQVFAELVHVVGAQLDRAFGVGEMTTVVSWSSVQR